MAAQGTAAGMFDVVHAVDPGDLAVPVLGPVVVQGGEAGLGTADGDKASAGDAKGVIHWRCRAQSAIA